MESRTMNVKTCVDMCLKVIRMYDWLLDLYVLDFYVEDHWHRLPKSWQKNLDNIALEELGKIISHNPTNHVFPLSLLALIKTVEALEIPRKSKYTATEYTTINTDIYETHPKLKNLFLKHVKLKKRHEVSVMADLVSNTAAKSKCNAVIDFGSGLGHLVRMLAYKNDLYAAGIECQKQLTEEARKLDQELEYTAKKYKGEKSITKLHRPIHFNTTLSNHNQLQELPLPIHMQNYGLIGLHPCGDLGPLLLKQFVYNKSVKFICVVGCCYMKLTTEGYPMSDYVKNLNSELSYVSREISCHAIEMYCERLRQGRYEDLKVHAYRAALEKILVELDPKLKHSPVRSLKHTQDMTFEKYCTLAVERLNLPMPLPTPAISRGLSDLQLWKRVVVVYTLRLALAPLVETLVLLDRLLFVLEQGLSVEIHPVFDPKLSPRNHVIIARR